MNHTVIAVVVTYDDRWCYLKRVLEHLENNSSVVRVILIDNASTYGVVEKCHENVFKKTKVYRNESNSGSSGGFRQGISLACDQNDSLVMLLDDDNLPRPDAIQGLIDTYNNLAATQKYPKLVITAFRENLHGNCKMPVKPLFMRDRDFLCFNVFNLFQRYLTINNASNTPRSGTEFAEFSGGVPYSGMLFSTEMVSDIGLPNNDFILYFDDFEYSIRMLKGGYTIWLDRENPVDDILENYSARAYKIPFYGFLMADSESKIYYNIRNRVYLDSFVDNKNSLPYLINMAIFLFIFSMLCLLTLRVKRLKTVLTACKHGQNGHLGLNNGYLL